MQAVLHPHVNTVRYRLDRIAERTALDLRHLDDLLALQVALRHLDDLLALRVAVRLHQELDPAL